MRRLMGGPTAGFADDDRDEPPPGSCRSAEAAQRSPDVLQAGMQKQPVSMPAAVKVAAEKLEPE